MNHSNNLCSILCRRIYLIILLGICIAVCSSLVNAASDLQLEPLISGLNNPVSITNAGDGTGRLFITLQVGQILIFDGRQLLPAPFLDIETLISSGSERGLLSVAFHPNYTTNGFLYINYTDLNGDTVIARYSVSGNLNSVDTSSAAVILKIPQPSTNHNGGQLHFGPDGYLYIGTGDGGFGGDPLDNGQNLNSLLGKILRIDVDANFPYAIPSDNPFVNNLNAQPEIWALGLRNPWRFSFDRITGDLFIADVGEETIEEVDFQQSTSKGGENYGWRLMEGSLCFNPSTGCNDGSLTLPIIDYDHSLGNCSVTGGYRYRGTLYSDLKGIYLYADFCSGRIWGASQDASGNWTTDELMDTDLSISTFGEDEQGELYLAHFSSTNGTIYKITMTPPSQSSVSNGGGGGGCIISTVLKF